MEVVLENLSKDFGKIKAVDNLNLEISDGEFVALLGPSGCGKTTTLLMIAGIYKPTKGYIYFGEIIVNEMLPKDRKIGMVFQSYALYPHMTVFGNIAFPLALKKVPKDEIARKCKKVTKLMQIEELVDRRPAQLSGGQQQRVALCRALIKEPDILLLDEPLSNLDAKLRLEMRTELRKLQKKLGITMIFVTHDQIEAMSMADKIAVMSSGTLQQFSSSDGLYDHPENLFVAGFIGSPPMNFVNVFLKKTKDGFFLRNKDFQVAIPREMEQEIKNTFRTPEVILGIRPEDINIDSQKGIRAEVYAVELLGRDILVSFRIGDSIIRVITSPPFKADMGEILRLNFNVNKIHLFERMGQRSLKVVS